MLQFSPSPADFGVNLAGLLLIIGLFAYARNIKTDLENFKEEQSKKCETHKADGQAGTTRIENRLERIETLLINHIGQK